MFLKTGWVSYKQYALGCTMMNEVHSLLLRRNFQWPTVVVVILLQNWFNHIMLSIISLTCLFSNNAKTVAVDEREMSNCWPKRCLPITWHFITDHLIKSSAIWSVCNISWDEVVFCTTLQDTKTLKPIILKKDTSIGQVFSSIYNLKRRMECSWLWVELELYTFPQIRRLSGIHY